MAKIEEKVETLIKKTIEDIGYQLYDTEYVKEGKNYFLRIFIDKEDGIDLNDCEKVNNAIIDLLDEADYIKEQYFLEVSSPGVERVLRKDNQLEDNVGEKISVHLFKSQDKEKQLIGVLETFDAQDIHIKIEDKKITIPRKNISLIKTVYDW